MSSKYEIFLQISSPWVIMLFVVAGDYTGKAGSRQESIFDRNSKGPRCDPMLHLHAAPGQDKLLTTSH